MVGKEIRRIRRENHLSQEDFAEKAGVSRQTVHNWENDLADPSLEKLSELSILFQVPLTSFLSGVPAAAPPPQAEVSRAEEGDAAQRVSKAHRIILLSVILFFGIVILTFVLLILGLRAYPTNMGQSYVVHDDWHFSDKFIFWTVFTVAIVIVAVLVFLIVRLARKGRRPRK